MRFLDAADADERKAMTAVVESTVAEIRHEVMLMVRHAFGVQGVKTLRDEYPAAMNAEIHNIAERVVEEAYYAGGRDSFGKSQPAAESLKAALIEAHVMNTKINKNHAVAMMRVLGVTGFVFLQGDSDGAHFSRPDGCTLTVNGGHWCLKCPKNEYHSDEGVFATAEHDGVFVRHYVEPSDG